MQNLRGGTAIVTGAATSTGSAIALALAEHGCAHIYLGDESVDGLQTCQRAIRKQYPLVKIDVQQFDRSNEDAVESFFLKAAKALERIDYAVNVVSQAQDLENIPVGHTIDGFDRHFRIYQRGAFLIQRALLRQMLKQDVLPERSDSRGSIVNVVDYGPTPTLADLPVLATIAFAIIGFSKTDACDYAPDRIRVNCLAASEVMIEKSKPELPGGVPLPRKGVPDDVANAAIWLSSSESSWLTGLVVPVDGGRSLHHWW